MKKSAYRIIDANNNRSREALRVCEDIARFAINSRTLAGSIKSARHQIGAILRGLRLDKGELLSSRDASSDIGRNGEYDISGKKDLTSIFAANIRRSEESLRVLEEFVSMLDRKASLKFKKIRFNLYDLEKAGLEKL